LRFSAAAVVEAARSHLALPPEEIPVGTRIHATGTVGSDGALVVTEISAQLPATSIRGKISTIDAMSITLSSGSGEVRGSLAESATVDQGTHALAVSDLVVGDDVTLYGYRVVSGVLVRKVLVHRPRVTVTGTVASISSDGFSVSASDGTHRVIVSGSTVVTGDSISVGMAAHVSGYRRGDGAILALSVKLTKPKIISNRTPRDLSSASHSSLS
jgi:hypothetical protein